MIVKLKLPTPSDSLLSIIKHDASVGKFDTDGKRWLDEFYGGTINAAWGLFYNANDAIANQMRQEFQQFFPKHKMGMIIGIMKGSGSSPTCQPPHIDRGRALAVNYYVDTGGNDVTTVFYNLTRPTLGESSYNIQYHETGGIYTEIKFEQGWYAYDVNRCHSVENIQGTRLFFAIRLISDHTQETDHHYDLNALLQDYPDLIDEINTEMLM